MRMVTLLYKCILLATFLSLASCRSRKVDVQEERRQKQESMQVQRETEQRNFDFTQNQKYYSLNTLGFGRNLSLESKDSTQPARITEYREGIPFRSLEVYNGSYEENESIKDSSNQEAYQTLTLKYTNLKSLYSKQNIQIKELKKQQEQTKVEGAKLANNFKYALWFLLLIAIIYIGQSTGIFKLFKRRLNIR